MSVLFTALAVISILSTIVWAIQWIASWFK